MNEPLSASVSEAQLQAEVLAKALPHMQRYDDAIVVVKYGGHAISGEEGARTFAQDIVLLEQSGVNPVVVHGGGPQIGAMLAKLGIKSEFAAGLRITDKATVEIVEMVLAGSINKQIVGFINEAGGKAIGLCGKDGNMVRARKANRVVVDNDQVVDLGFVGEPDTVDTTVLDQILGRELIPVPGPGGGGGGRRHLQCERRYLRRRHRRRAGGQALPAAHRRARACWTRTSSCCRSSPSPRSGL